MLGPVRGSVHSSPPELSIQLLGPLRVLRADVAVPLPASRKLRALVAYLAMSTRPQSREHLCKLLWPLPDDPRAQLRICLSSARKVIDAPERARVVCDDAGLRLDLQGVDVDALQVDAAVQAGLERQTLEQLHALVARISGEFLEGQEIDHCPAFTGWLVAQRRRFRAAHLALLEALALRLPADAPETLDVLGRWLQLAPFDRRAHTTLLSALALREAWHEGEAHLSAAVRSFEAERLDPGCLVDAWQRVRQPAKPAVPLDAVRATLPANQATAVPRRAAIAVMPFEEPSALGPGRVANALVHDVITGLAKLRTLFVIARGTVFSLAQRHIGPEDAARLLNVDYYVAGHVRRREDRLRVSVDLVETHSARVVWTEVFDQPMDKAFTVLDAIGQRIVTLIAGQVETVERNRALLKPPGSLDAWDAYHRGFWHMYRCRPDDTEQAIGLFEQAVRLDPTFSRAHSGLSFAHFHKAFNGWGDREAATAGALEAAGHGLMADDQDPAAHFVMGQALWLIDDTRSSLAELETAVSLSPSFALAHFKLSFVNSQTGDPEEAIRAADRARNLSPFDPVLFAMYATRATALMRLGRYEEAAESAVKAARSPNAMVHTQAFAALCLTLANRMPEAHAFAAAMRRMVPGYREADLDATFRFEDDAKACFRRAAQKLGW